MDNALIFYWHARCHMAPARYRWEGPASMGKTAERLMKAPIQSAPVLRGSSGAYQVQSLKQQSCNPLEWAGCAAAVASCVATGPGIAACVAAIAPACVKCVT